MASSEKIRNLSFWGRWIYALKIQSWPKLMVPFLLGQSYGVVNANEVSWIPLVLGLAYNVFLLGFIVLLNDYADVEVDTIKRQLFPANCSPKTIPDGILSKKTVLIVGLSFGFLSILTAVFLELYTEKPYIFILSIISIVVFMFYSLPPIKLNYRGGGEILEMLGVGFFLPTFHFYIQYRLLFDLEFGIILILSTIFALASALASGMSDEKSDTLGGKTTFITLIGNNKVRKIIVFLCFINTMLMFFFLKYFNASFSIGLTIVMILFLIYQCSKLVQISPSAVTNNFEAQRIFKDHLHKAIWGSFVLVSGFKIYSVFLANKLLL
ncbi:prenyltransferase [Leptospira sp. 96542]|nr:prenyltransferase [Leptospira sp. 96542]